MSINDRHIAGEELTDAERDEWNDAHKKARESLQRSVSSCIIWIIGICMNMSSKI